jgi:hypothetical protein
MFTLDGTVAAVVEVVGAFAGRQGGEEATDGRPELVLVRAAAPGQARPRAGVLDEDKLYRLPGWSISPVMATRP